MHNQAVAQDENRAEFIRQADKDQLVNQAPIDAPPTVYVDGSGRASTRPPAYTAEQLRGIRYLDQLPAQAREDWDYLTMTLFGEARGSNAEGKRAVANVIMNRLREGRWGNTVRQVVQKAQRNQDGDMVYQFSCWGDTNRDQIEEMHHLDQQYLGMVSHDPAAAEKFKAELDRNPDWRAYQEAKSIAWKVLTGQLSDITNGANHYHGVHVRPWWISKMVRTTDNAIGGHYFFRDRPGQA